jgi:Distinct helicase family with a unique C-terminal domain including a metal-binding cysteine cluster
MPEQHNLSLQVTSEVNSVIEEVKNVLKFDPYPWQIQAWKHISSRQDVIVIVSTGHGKSLCFQYAHFLKSGGTTLVISPLKALMQNQVLPKSPQKLISG